MNLRKRVRTVAPAEPGAGAVATLDDPRLGAVSAALARLRPQLVPDPDAPDTGDDYLAETEYGSTTSIAAAEPPATPEPASIGSRWAAALGRIQPPVRRADPEPEPESIAEPEFVAPRPPVPEPVVEPVVSAEPAPAIQSEPVPEPSSFSELQSVLAAVLEAETPAAESPVAAMPVAELDDEAPIDDEPREAELVSAGVVAAPWTAELDGTLLPRAPLHRSRLPHRLTGAFNRPRRRRRRH